MVSLDRPKTLFDSSLFFPSFILCKFELLNRLHSSNRMKEKRPITVIRINVEVSILAEEYGLA